MANTVQGINTSQTEACELVWQYQVNHMCCNADSGVCTHGSGCGNRRGAYMCSNAGVQPAGVVVVAHEHLMLDHVSGVVHSGADFTPDLDLLQGHHHGPDCALTRLALGKKVPKLHHSIYCLYTV